MQIEIIFAAAYDFNQYMQYAPRPSPSHRFLALPLPAPPRPVRKIASPSIPARKCQNQLTPPYFDKLSPFVNSNW